jgi:Fur family ferric uptake transcriptional regulator
VKPLFLTDGSLKYEYVGSKDHHHHLICTDCGEILEIEGCAVEGMEEQVQKKTRFKILHHTLEMYGVCPECQSSVDSKD